MSSSVVSPIAERTPTTRSPRSCARTSRRATFLIFSGSATEVPPNFITTMAECCLRHLAAPRESAAQRDLVGVLEIAAHRQSAGKARHADAVAQPSGEVRRGRLAGRVRVRRENHLDDAVRLNATGEATASYLAGR